MHATVRPTKRDLARGLLAAACLLAVACSGDGGGSHGAVARHGIERFGDLFRRGTARSTLATRCSFRRRCRRAAVETQAAANAAWASGAPAVATVSPSGLVTAVSAGEATISAEVPAGSRGLPEFHGHWEGDLNVTSIVVPPEWRELGEEDCNGLPDCASWIPLAADFTQDGATVTGTVTSTFAASPNYEWTIQSGTVSSTGRSA